MSLLTQFNRIKSSTQAPRKTAPTPANISFVDVIFPLDLSFDEVVECVAFGRDGLANKFGHVANEFGQEVYDEVMARVKGMVMR